MSNNGIVHSHSVIKTAVFMEPVKERKQTIAVCGFRREKGMLGVCHLINVSPFQEVWSRSRLRWELFDLQQEDFCFDPAHSSSTNFVSLQQINGSGSKCIHC